MARSHGAMLPLVALAAIAALVLTGSAGFVAPRAAPRLTADGGQQVAPRVAMQFFSGGAASPSGASSAASGARPENSTVPQIFTLLFVLSVLVFPVVYKL